MRAEEAGDFETALYLELLREPSQVGCGDRSLEVQTRFRTAYLKLRVGIEPKQQWRTLIESFPTSLEDPTSRAFHKSEYFERVAMAARVAHEERAAIDWFRLVRNNYSALNGHNERDKNSLSQTELGPREMELLLGGYISELHASLCASASTVMDRRWNPRKTS